MNVESKREYLSAIKVPYQRAKKEEKNQILDEFCRVCGYHRKHAIRLLGRAKKKVEEKKGKVGRKVAYGPEVVEVVKKIWLLAEQMCSRRVKEALPLWLPYYEQEYGTITDEIRVKVLALSAATIDRLLKSVRVKDGRKGLCGTKPGTLLRNQIPIRTNHWDVTKPGYLEADTVAHCGKCLIGNFVWSLTFTDIFSGWTENRAIWNKGAFGVIEQVKSVESALVFPVLGFDTDNGSEFLNAPLLKYFIKRKNPVQFTRCRPYKKNDNAHVEQKNWTHVRQLLGYDRLDDPDLVPIINDLYTNEWSLFQNYFCPTMKLLRKERFNSKTRRFYEKPRTPFQRLIDSPDILPDAKQRLLDTRAMLNPILLKKTIEMKLDAIYSAIRRRR